MKTHDEAREVTTHGVLRQNRFRIKNNAKAFKVLIDKLYSDKPRAIVRELWSNAYDSHVEAGCPERPFECHAPTVFEPYFSVRDFGVGMTQDQVMNLYSTVFESSKEDSNAVVGKWGLGSKSPFSYTDTFTVTAYSGTVAEHYSVFIDGEGYPNIALMHANPDTSARGIEVSFPVGSNDVGSFTQAIKRVSAGFDVHPTVNCPLPAREIEMAGAGWVLLNDVNSLNTIPEYTGGMYARQGCVLYPVDTAMLPDMTDLERAVVSSSIIASFPIGDLEINPAREGLSYDTRTIANIKQRCEEIAADMASRFSSEINSAPNYYEACVKMNEIITSVGGDIGRVLRHRLTFRGNKLKKEIVLDTLLFRYAGADIDAGGLRVQTVSRNDVFRGSRATPLIFMSERRATITVGSEVLVVWDDPHNPARFPHTRLAKAFNDHGYSCVVWVRCARDCMAMKKLLVKLGRRLDEYVVMADLPRPTADKGSVARTVVKVKLFNNRGDWVDGDAASTDEVYYVKRYRDVVVVPRGVFGTNERPMDDGVVMYDYELSRLVAALKGVNALPPNAKIIGVPKSLNRLIAKNEAWVDLIEFAKGVFETSKGELPAVIKYNEHTDARNRLEHTPEHLIEYRWQFGLHSVASNYFALMDELVAGCVNEAYYQALTGLFLLFALPVPLDENSSLRASVRDANALWEETYPLLTYIPLNNDTIEPAINYINLVDNAAVDKLVKESNGIALAA